MPLSWFLWLLAALNTLSWLAFGVDKLLARRHGGRENRRAGRYQRVPETWLLLLAAAGGFVGSWLAIRCFRHKTRKVSFRVRLVVASLVAIVWIGALGWNGYLVDDYFADDAASRSG